MTIKSMQFVMHVYSEFVTGLRGERDADDFERDTLGQ